MFLPPGFDRAIALEAADLVNQAYSQYDHFVHGTPWNLQGDYKPPGLLSAKPAGLFPRLEPFGFVAQNKTSGNVFVTFRGTQSLEDWLSNISFPQVPHPWGHVEDGFQHIFAQCSADAQKFVKAAGTPNVFVTGHSLGGALAVLATADLVVSATGASAIMYSFAGPRTGDRPFAGQFNGKVKAAWRVVNTEDIVTTVPLATPELAAGKPTAFAMMLALAHRLDYEHVGTAVSFTTHNGSIVANHDMKVYQAAL